MRKLETIRYNINILITLYCIYQGKNFQTAWRKEDTLFKFALFSWYTHAGSVSHTHSSISPYSMHRQTHLHSLLLPPYHPHWNKSSLLQRVKPGLIWTVALPSRSYSWSLLCLQQSYYTTYQVSPSVLQENRSHTHTHRLKTITTIYSFSFYSSLCLEIAGSIFSLITLLDMMHQNLLYLFYRNTLNRTQGFTMDTRLTFCPLHLQQWMTFSRFFVSFFPVASLHPHHFADHIHHIKDLLIVWQKHSTLQLLWRFFPLVLQTRYV